MVCRNEKGQFTATQSLPAPPKPPTNQPSKRKPIKTKPKRKTTQPPSIPPKPLPTEADRRMLRDVRRKTDELEAEWKKLEEQYERLSWELRNDVATVQGAEIVARKMRELKPKIKMAEYEYMGQRAKLLKLKKELGLN